MGREGSGSWLPGEGRKRVAAGRSRREGEFLACVDGTCESNGSVSVRSSDPEFNFVQGKNHFSLFSFLSPSHLQIFSFVSSGVNGAIPRSQPRRLWAAECSTDVRVQP